MDNTINDWDSLKKELRLRLTNIRYQQILKTSEKLIALFQTSQDLPVPMLSHFTMTYCISEALGWLCVEIINNEIFELGIYNHDFSEQIYGKKTKIFKILPELEQLLIDAPCLLHDYMIKKGNSNRVWI